MNKVKLLSIIIVGLLISNLALVCFLFFKKPPFPKQEGPRDSVIEKLHFDDSQIKEYDKMIGIHRTEILAKENEIRILKNKLYSTLKQSKNDTVDSLIQQLGKVQCEIETIHYAHFEAIKKLCHENQIQDYYF